MDWRSSTAAFVFLLFLADARAASIQLKIEDGLVWLVARDADVRQILAEWERIGGTKITDADRISGRPITLELSAVPETQALDVVLRGASGFVALRRATATASQSQFERITIVATSHAPVAPPTAPIYAAPPPPSPVMIAPGVQRLIGPDGQPVADDQDDAPTSLARPASIPPGFDTPPRVAPPPPATPPVGVPVPGVPVTATNAVRRVP
jgi:hypothetical protein